MKESPDFYLDFLACEHFNCDMDELAEKDPEQVAFIKAGIWQKEVLESKNKRCPL